MRASFAILALLSLGCASMTAPERASLVVTAADIATTAYALDHGTTESNPLFSWGARSDGEVLARAIAFNAAGHWLLHRYFSRFTEAMEKRGWRIVLGIRTAPLLWNLSVIERRD